MTAQSPNAISMPVEAAAAVSTMATARVRKYGPWRRQLEGPGARDARSSTRCAVGSKPGGGAMEVRAASALWVDRGIENVPFPSHCLDQVGVVPRDVELLPKPRHGKVDAAIADLASRCPREVE